MEFKAYHTEDRALLVKTRMNFETLCLEILEPMKQESINIVVYADMDYVSDIITSLENYHKNRIQKEKLTIANTSQTVVK